MAERDKRKMMNTARHKKPSSRSASKDRLMLMNQDGAQDPTEEQFYDAQDGDSCLLAKGNDRGRPRPRTPTPLRGVGVLGKRDQSPKKTIHASWLQYSCTSYQKLSSQKKLYREKKLYCKKKFSCEKKVSREKKLSCDKNDESYQLTEVIN